jgi:hypothetical protein
MDSSFRDEWQQKQVDTIANALQDLMQGDNGKENAKEAIYSAIMSWYDYHNAEAMKWSSLLNALKTL